jgi:CheY-like chemotaxis protein
MRLVDIGIEAFKISAALKGIVAQRLVRRLCPQCAEQVGPETLPAAARPTAGFGRAVHVRTPRGCEKCLFTGYRGRFAIEEILPVQDEVAEVIASNGSAERVSEAGRRAGMRTLWEAGLRRVWAGETGYDEVVRVVGEPGTRARPSQMAVAPAPEPAATAVAAAPTASAGPPLVLVADDDPTNRVLESGILRAEGFRVAVAEHGIQALVESQRLKPDVLLLDMDMPQLDGFGVMGALRQSLSGRALPIIVITARDDPETETRCIELGAEDFIAKPIHPATLVARVRAVLRRVGTGV